MTALTDAIAAARAHGQRVARHDGDRIEVVCVACGHTTGLDTVLSKFVAIGGHSCIRCATAAWAKVEQFQPVGVAARAVAAKAGRRASRG